ncbi:transposable element Tcb1 transposase [Trichonephila clavipes]|nr:transposable element Tcb1 transposase [Trichonephila clavipes]
MPLRRFRRQFEQLPQFERRKIIGMMEVGWSASTWSPLVLIHGTMTAQWYVHDILQPHVLPLIQRLPGALFQQDNVRPHTARVSQVCLRTVNLLPWPA